MLTCIGSALKAEPVSHVYMLHGQPLRGCPLHQVVTVKVFKVVSLANRLLPLGMWYLLPALKDRP